LRKLYPFWIVFSIELSFIAFLIVSHRGVIGDAFQYFTLQYYFLNNAVTSGETAQWLPLVTHGTVANWWFGVQGGIFQSAMLALGRLNSVLDGWNFLPVYYVGILFDLSLYLLGVVLLARRYFASNFTILFVAITALGSTTWFTQTWFNLHFYYALPLMLHLVHVLLETGKWRYFLLAGNLFAVQCNGDLPYLAPFTALVICVYTFFCTVFFWKTAGQQLKALLSNWKNAIVPVVVVIASLYVVSGMLNDGTEQIVNYSPGRTLDGRNVSLDAFLSYGTNSNFRWAEFVSRVSPALDYSLYSGYLSLVFVVLAFTRRRRPMLWALACTALVVFLLSNSTPLASVFYFVWPGMQYFRHLSLGATVFRTLLCFLAGFGFERIFFRDPAVEPGDRAAIRIAIILFTAWSGFLLAFSQKFEYARALIWLSVEGSLPLDPRVFAEGYLSPELVRSSLWCLSAAALLSLLLWGRISAKRLAAVAIIFQALDIYSFKFDLVRLRTMPLTETQYDITRFQAVPYSRRRSLIDYSIHPRGKEVPQNTPRLYSTANSIYWTQDLLMFTDPLANIGRADHWLLSLDDFLRTYSGDRMRDLEHKPKAFRPRESLKFPFEQPNALKLAGVTEDKIQFFSRAHLVGTDQAISQTMSSKDFNGDMLLLPGTNNPEVASLETNDRVQRDYEVVQYDANNIRILVKDAAQGDWLYYADCWHPFWSVTVNGRHVALSKANLAYKAVQLDQGESVVHLRFYSARLTFFFTLLGWNAVVWILLPGYMLLGFSLSGSPSP